MNAITYETYRELTRNEMLAYLTLDLQEATVWDQAQGCWCAPAEVLPGQKEAA